MRWQHPKIGFDDRLVTVLGVIVMAFLIPIVFLGMGFRQAPYYTWECFWMSLVCTAMIWVGVRYIMIWSRLRYPGFEQTRRRLWVQAGLMLVFTLTVNNLLDVVLDWICHRFFPGDIQPGVDYNTRSNFAALFCTLAAVAIYESIYFMAELRKSIEAQEGLKRESLQAQLSALKTQVNPHFLFNNLNTLCAIIPEEPEQAVAFVQQLSRVYRHILEVKDEPSILLSKELDVLKAYAFLLKTRFGGNLDISIQVREEKLGERVVPLSLQILMENAIKHNIVSAAKPLHIRVFSEEGRLVVSNTLQKKQQVSESTGIGLANIRNRYRLLSDQEVEVHEEPAQFTVYIPLICAS
ncbi:sensor histidine kinase [Dinghuibacter silviterrae]|uniref:Histidine kinase n=1 Tax=Dinghuibacter silviterrae TaxID=1539049 RepID=A0A4R8DWV7_9BACT|nr:histidine kinase [Dinghuibacter silviterrae]TDX02015.1 histidine kinase [Dinghuibacter silviterrae]